MDRAEFQELVRLIERSSPEIAAKTMYHLDALNRSGKLDPESIEQLKNIARPKIGDKSDKVERYAAIDRLFFEPFTLLFESPDHKDLLPGSFPRAKLASIWQAIAGSVINAEISDFEAAAGAAMEENDTYSCEKIMAQVREKVIEKIESSKDFGLIAKYNSAITETEAKRFYGLLKVEQAARDNNINLATDIDQMSCEKGSRNIELLLALEEVDVNWAADYIVMIMVRSKKPWHVIKLLTTVAFGTNDRKLSATPYSLVGDRILAILDRKLEEFEKIGLTSEFDGVQLANDVEEFNKVNQGLERESIMTSDGPWRKKITETRQRAGTLFPNLCKTAVNSVEVGFPIERMRVRGVGMYDIPRTYNEPNLQKVNTALAFCDFIREVRLFAPLAGFGVPRDNALKEIIKHSDSLKNGLFAVKNQGEPGKYFDDWVKNSTKLVIAIDGQEAAKSFSRRIAA